MNRELEYKVEVLRLQRTTLDLPPPEVQNCAKFSGKTHFAAGGVYDPWFCVACGHPHHGMQRHHRLPRRVAWKIPEKTWRKVLGDPQRIVPVCAPCHRFVERQAGAAPCGDRPDPRYALLPWIRLMDEIATFDRIAYERTEQLIRTMRAGLTD